MGYRPWYFELGGKVEKVNPVSVREQGKGIVAQVAGIEDRDAAAGLIGANIFVNRDLFAQVGSDEYYWSDLVGLRVVTIDGESLGIVNSLLETGANDVLVVTGDRRRLIPFVTGDVVKRVDLEAALITVDWDPEF